MAAKRPTSNGTANGSVPVQPETGEGRPEQALALVGMGLLQKMAANGELPWVWNESEDAGACDPGVLRTRLELTDLALKTGAPLSTAEVTYLMGARPGAAVVERGGLKARRVSRNVWKLSRQADRPQTDDAFRRRF